MQPNLNRVEALVTAFKAGYYDLLSLSPKQVEALGFLADTNTAALAFGGAANGGKSWLGCEWEILNCLAYPGTRWFIGREELKRLRESTLLTFYKVARKLGISAGAFKYNGQDHFIQFSNGSRVDLLELKYLPSDPLYERYGSVEYTGGWIEEGGEVAFDAYDTLKSRVGRHFNDKYGLLGKILITCNPKKNWLYTYFYKPNKEGTIKPTLKFLQSLVTDNPNRESGALEALDSITNKAKKERLRFGNWEYDDDPSVLMSFDAISDIFTNSHVSTGEKYLTADIARKGGDKTVLMVWSGFRVEKVVSYQGILTNVTVMRIQELMRQEGIPASHVVIDEDGVGGGVVDNLPGAKGFVNNSKPLPNPEETDPTKKTTRENYDNLKSQCYFRLAKMVNNHSIYVSCGSEIQHLLTEELEQVKEKDVDSEKKLGVIPKEKIKELLGRSPDYADALMMRIYFTLNVKQQQKVFTI